MVFKRSALRYGETPEPVTPYQKAAQAWDARIGSARVQAHNWRLMALGNLGMSLLLAGILFWVGRTGGVVPYIVEVDSRGGARTVGPADESYKPRAAQIAYHLARFVDNARDNDPFDRIGRQTVAVEVSSVVRASDTSFQVRWTERTFEGGALKDTKRLTGLFSIALTPPRTVDAVRKNPLGIYVHAFNWSQDVTTGESK